MTTNPLTVEKDKTVYEAATLMQHSHIRHIPALYMGKIEGILSMTDVNWCFAIKNADITKMKVYEAYTPNPVIFSPETPVDEVCREMAKHKIGCVLIADKERLVGIFTWIDALHAMDELLHTRLN